MELNQSELIFLFKESRILFPLYSILIKCKPKKQKNKGTKKLIHIGKNPKILKITSAVPAAKNSPPKEIYKFKLSLFGFKSVKFLIIFP
jgi:hypothetical protein